MNNNVRKVLIQLVLPIAAIYAALYLFNTCMGDVPPEDRAEFYETQNGFNQY